MKTHSTWLETVETALAAMCPAGSREALPVARLGLVLAALGACGTRGREESPANHWQAPASAAGAEQCAECHAGHVTAWSRTGMARALGPVRDEDFAGLGAVLEQQSGYGYHFREAPEGVSIVETRPDTPAHELAAPLVFAIGAGRLDRSYAALLGSLLWFAPLEVVRFPAGRRAELAPGHMIAPGTRFQTPISAECLGCHTDALPPPSYPLNLHDADWSPRGIGCGACHVAVDQHAAYQRGDSDAAADPLRAHDDFTRVERLSVCAACHLQGDARIVLEPGVLGPPLAGGDLLEQRAVYVAAEPTQEVGFVSQVERLVESACFKGTQMTCETCHDPHRSLDDARARQLVRDACEVCHSDSPSPGDSQSRGGSSHALTCPVGSDEVTGEDCVSCHMRLTPVFDVANVAIHDHFIRRDPGAPSPPVALRVAESPEGTWRRFAWPDEPLPDHFDDPGLRMMALHGAGHRQAAAALIDSAPGGLVRSLPMFHHVRGSILELLQRDDEAEAAYRRALELDPGLAVSSTNLGLLLGRTARAAEGVRVLNETLERFPAAEGALRNRALLRYQLQDGKGFVEDLRAAHDLVPRAELARTLASFYDTVGDVHAARRWRTEAARLDPLGAAVWSQR